MCAVNLKFCCLLTDCLIFVDFFCFKYEGCVGVSCLVLRTLTIKATIERDEESFTADMQTDTCIV